MVTLQRCVGYLVVSLLVSTTEYASASVVVAQTVEQMALEAQVVVEARVRGQHVEWDRRHQRIFTITKLEVLEVWFGQASSVIEVRTLGGQLDGIAMSVSGTPHFRDGEEVVVFLSPDAEEKMQYRVLGLSQGMFRVEERDEIRTAVPAVHGLIRTSRRNTSSRSEALPLTSTPLSILRGQVETARGTTF
ncbi:MAG: hypothetical protein KTR25_19935 [Myxococcales bacterium]|nr:hypothetical protein [Myxococcales bacterium]